MGFVARRWRIPKVVLGLFLLELPFTVALLAFFGIAAPNLYRTKLWQDGGDNGFNSSPNAVLYAYANYRPAKIPLVWSQFMTNFNIVVSVLSMFLLLVKVTMFVLHVFVPMLSIFVHALLVALYAVAVRNQSAPDTLDPKHKNTGLPWYITKSCNVAHDKSNVGYCQQAKASFYVTVLMLALFSIIMIISIWSAFPTEDEKLARMSRHTRIEFSASTKNTPDSTYSTEQKWEMSNIQTMQVPYPSAYPQSPASLRGMRSPIMPMTPMTPVTPRTMAFHALDGNPKDLPLRRYG